jgi:hypothetical protein
MFKAGVEPAIVLNYKWKHFLHGDRVSRGNEFLSNKAAIFYPSIFAGISLSGFSVTGNFYPTNFFDNPLIDARLFTVGVGLNIDDNFLKFNLHNKKKK